MKRLFAAAPLLLAAHGAIAQAQTAPAPPVPAPADTNEAAGEIIVTAQKRSQSLQDVPLTVSVFGAQQVKEARINQMVDVANRTPGLEFDNFPATQPRPAIRGIGSSDRGAAGDPSTAVYVDDVYYGRPAAFAFDAFDVERIEVLKGPQGTLWGKNVVGGLIHVVDRKPQVDRTDFSIQGTIGTYMRADAAGYLNLPVTDTSAFRVSVSTRHRDGFARNTYLGKRVEDENTTSGRLQYLIKPTDRLTVLLGGDYTIDRLAGSNRHTVSVDPTSSLAPFWANAIDTRAGTVRQDTNGHQNRDSYGVRLGADWQLDPFTVTSISSYRWLKYHVLEDLDGGNPTTNRINVRGGQDESSKFASQELRLSAPSSSKIKWVLGGYYYHGTTSRADTFLLDMPPQRPGSFAAIDRFNQHAVTDSVAVFGDLTVPLTSKLNVFGGVRYSHDHKDYDLDNRSSTALLRAATRYAISTSEGWGKVTYRAGLDYRIAPRVLAYGLVSTGFKSGGFQDTPATAASAQTPFAPETATNYEIGIKASLFDRKLMFNPSLYWTDYKDLQVRQTIGLDTFTTNAGSARIRGVELTAVAGPFGGFTLAGTYALTDARYRELIDRGIDYSGNRLTRNPHDKVTLSPSYRYELASGATITTTVDYQFESKIYDDFNNSPVTTRPSKNLVDARIVVNGANKKWDLAIWGKNLGNEVYITHQFLLVGGHFASYGPRRTFGATLTLHR